jgi:uncharacterized membrane protein (UPF0127 family)
MKNGLKLLVIPVAALLLTACGGPDQSAQQPTQVVVPTPTTQLQQATTPTGTPWVPPTALAGTPLPGAVATLTAAPALNRANITITNKAGSTVQMEVEIADSDASRQLGLMHRAQMDPSAGMLFAWPEDSTGGFWMRNTILPLSIAFIAADGTIIYIADMQPLDESTVGPTGPYRYALETNQGFFRANNIEVGDKVTLPGAQSAVIPGMPPCSHPPQAQGALQP